MLGLAAFARALGWLAKTDRITIVNTGGDSLGASKITGDVAKIIAQLPPVIQSLSGVDLADLVARLPKLGEKDRDSGKTPPKK